MHLGSRVRAGREDVRVGELEDLVEALTEAKGRQCGSAAAARVAAARAVAAARGQFSLFSQHFLLFSSSPA